MPNSCYLCCSDYDGIYPSSQDSTFDAEHHTVAYGVRCIPLLWMTLFRPADMRRQTVQVKQTAKGPQTGLAPAMELVDLDFHAPFATKDTAIRQIEDSLSHLNSLFSDNGPLDDHVAQLSEAVTKTPGRFVTVELDEIIPREDSARFRGLDVALQFFATPLKDVVRRPKRTPLLEHLLSHWSRQPLHVARRSLLSISGVDTRRTFHSPIGFWERDDVTDADQLNLSCLLGMQLYRPVPWEPLDDG